jgi:hypothetical protein
MTWTTVPVRGNGPNYVAEDYAVMGYFAEWTDTGPASSTWAPASAAGGTWSTESPAATTWTPAGSASTTWSAV